MMDKLPSITIPFISRLDSGHVESIIVDSQEMLYCPLLVLFRLYLFNVCVQNMVITKEPYAEKRQVSDKSSRRSRNYRTSRNKIDDRLKHQKIRSIHRRHRHRQDPASRTSESVNLKSKPIRTDKHKSRHHLKDSILRQNKNVEKRQDHHVYKSKKRHNIERRKLINDDCMHEWKQAMEHWSNRAMEPKRAMEL
jgi:hypothetical protein